MKQFGMDAILKPMIDDLKQLSTEGFVVNICGTEHKVYAALATFSADNLSAHMIGGFRMSFSSGRICRHCMASHGEINHKFQEHDFVQRTTEVHKYHIQSYPYFHAYFVKVDKDWMLLKPGDELETVFMK